MTGIPARERLGRIISRFGGRPKKAVYYPREDGGHVATSGRFAGKRVSERDYRQDAERDSKHKPVRKGYGRLSDPFPKKKNKNKKKK